ncbi:MarR family winged helix-turn-helix transcriptional regulator [Evansella tamaricis]|uniref:MarR family transcriptional regulator n=1 Tax=Evansella tamaricis TaxID=2069301 RepID=A0ABS6JGS4_9BACI|nr:MarR family transcriptional regulator [Evansella tamaricis]MBU9712842.1 MarR family transcriptional regulator [Evansella tamaricis]
MVREMDRRVGYQLGIVSHLLQNAYNNKLSEYGLTTSQAKVLYVLNKQGNMLQAEIQKYLYIQSSTMNGIMESMLKRELINKQDDKNDRRSKMISLTEKGRELEETFWEELSSLEMEITKGLSEEEQQLLLVWLKRVKTNIENLTENKQR